MIDRDLNYGRHLIEKFSAQALRDSVETPFVVDLGAGSGTDLKLVRKSSLTARLCGAESYPPNIAKLRQLGFETIDVNLETDVLPFKNESVDLILANQVLEHTKEIFWISHEVSRTLKVGGHFLVGVPNLASFHNRLLLLCGRQPTAIQTASAHIRGFTKHDFSRYLQKCFPGGYELTAFGGSNFYPMPPLFAKPLASLWSNGAVGIFFLLKKVRAYEQSFIEYPVQNRLETNYFLGPQATPAAQELRPLYT